MRSLCLLGLIMTQGTAWATCAAYFKKAPPPWLADFASENAPEFQVFIFSRGSDPFGSLPDHQLEQRVGKDGRTRRVLRFLRFGSEPVPVLEPHVIVVDPAGRARFADRVLTGTQLIQPFPESFFAGEAIPFRIDLSKLLNPTDLPNFDSFDAYQIPDMIAKMEEVLRAMLQQFPQAIEEIKSRIDVRDDTASFGSVTKTDRLSTLIMHSFGFNTGPGTTWELSEAPNSMPNPAEILNYYQQQAVEHLAASFARQGIPKEISHQLYLQEAALADQRTIQFMILQRGDLKSYGRLYVGNRNNHFNQNYAGLVEEVSLSHQGFRMGSVPSYLVPAERTLSEGSRAAQAIEALRQGTEDRDGLFIELGRMRIDASGDERALIKSMHLSVLFKILSTITSNELGRATLLVDCGPAGRRHYKQSYGFKDLEHGEINKYDLDPRYRFDINVQVYPEPIPQDQNTQASKQKSKIYILKSTGDVFFKAVASQNPIYSLDGTAFLELMVDARFNYSGSFTFD